MVGNNQWEGDCEEQREVGRWVRWALASITELGDLYMSDLLLLPLSFWLKDPHLLRYCLLLPLGFALTQDDNFPWLVLQWHKLRARDRKTTYFHSRIGPQGGL
jgi:hypothetical protein